MSVQGNLVAFMMKGIFAVSVQGVIGLTVPLVRSHRHTSFSDIMYHITVFPRTQVLSGGVLEVFSGAFYRWLQKNKKRLSILKEMYYNT